MKDIFIAICAFIFAVLILSGCSRHSDFDDANTQNMTKPSDEQALDCKNNMYLYEMGEDTYLTHVDADSLNEYDIEKFGDIIVAAGLFWENWWSLSGAFSDEHRDWPAQRDEEHPEHLWLYTVLLPSSGFYGIECVINYLLQFYTDNWVNKTLHGDFPPFADYHGVLFMMGGVAGPGSEPRPCWNTATHSLVSKHGNTVIIDTTVTHGSWHRLLANGYPYPFEVIHRFIFVDGRIDSGPNGINVVTDGNR